ncbi:MAG: caspase family protein [Bacteroidota bacterium]
MISRSYLFSCVFLTVFSGNSVLSAQPGEFLKEIGNAILSVEWVGETLDATDEFIGEVTADLEELLEEEASVNHPQNGPYHAQRAARFFNDGKFEQAITEYGQAIRFSHQQPSKLGDYFYHRGLCHYILGRYQRSLEDLNRSIQYRSDVLDAYYFRGKIRYQELGDMGGRDDLAKVLQGNSEAIQRAYAHVILGQTSRARAIGNGLDGQLSSKFFQEKAMALYNLAGLYALLQEPTTSNGYLRQALSQGFGQYEWLKRDPNFRPIASNRTFISLLNNYGLKYQLTPMGGQISPPVSSTRPSAPAFLEAFDLDYEDTNANNQIDAFETSYIVFSLLNKGQGEAQGVTIKLIEETGLANLQFPSSQNIGTLGAGERREIRIPVTGMTGLKPATASFKLEVLEANGFDATDLHISIPTGEGLLPALSVVDHHFASELGGKMQLGVPITLKLAVQNTGQGTANNAQLSVVLPENVFTAGDKTMSLGNLAAGESKVIDVEFFTNKRYQGSDVPVTVQLTAGQNSRPVSSTFRVGINQQLEVNSRVVIKANPGTPANAPVPTVRLTSDVDRNVPRTNNRNPNAVAIIIGNRDYQHLDVPPVDFALHDAASVRKYLRTSFGYEEANIIFLPNATQADFNGTFGTKGDHQARLFNLVKPNETDVFIYYSGHGAPDVNTQEAYFVPVDCDPSLVRFNGYAINTFYENLSKVPYRSLTVVIDACFSGSSDRGTLIRNASLVRIKSDNSVLKDPNAQVFTSATGTQIASWLPQESHSLFTYYFLKGLQGAANTNGDRTLSLDELKAYLQQEVPAMARRLNNREQTPEVYGKGEKAVLEY